MGCSSVKCVNDSGLGCGSVSSNRLGRFRICCIRGFPLMVYMMASALNVGGDVGLGVGSMVGLVAQLRFVTLHRNRH